MSHLKIFQGHDTKDLSTYCEIFIFLIRAHIIYYFTVIYFYLL